MKKILSLIISTALVVSGYAQTRNVLVGTNNAVVQPTNFWSADASNARSGLGLGTAATNPSSAFQPASLVLSNLAASNGSVLTNLTASNITGALSVEQGGTGSTNASNARSALGLGSSATNPASAFQPSSSVLSNLATGNGYNLTNVQAASIVGQIPNSNIPSVTFTNISGTLAISQGGTSATNAYNARQNLGVTAVGDSLFTASNAATARTAIGGTTVGSSIFTLVNPSAITFLRINSDNTVSAVGASDFRLAIGLGSSATNSSTAFQPSSTMLSNLASSNGAGLTNIPLAGVIGALATNGSAVGLTNFPASLLTTNGNGAGLTNLTAANITGAIAISNGGSGATTAGGARTNLGLGWSALTNTNASTSLLGFTTNGQVVVTGTNVLTFTNDVKLGNGELTVSGQVISGGGVSFSYEDGELIGVIALTTNSSISFQGESAATTRANLGFSTNLNTLWTATNASNARSAIGLSSFVTNTNSPVFVGTNGEVVSPTNFWQVSPANTRVQVIQPNGATNSVTNTATNARNLYLYSLTPLVNNVTNTIQLPTNGGTLLGDVATVIHEGPTNSVTAIRQISAGTNIVTLNQFQEAVKFIYESGGWRLADNISQVEPIYFSGTNAAANAAASRTNLGLGATNTAFSQIGGVNTNEFINLDNAEFYGGPWSFDDGFAFNGAAAAATSRTNLGLGATWLTNTSVTNFRTAIELGTNNNVSFGSVTVGTTSVRIASDIGGGAALGWNGDNTRIVFGSLGMTLNNSNAAINFGGSNTTGADITRTNLGIPLAALTNTNNANFQAAIFTTNSAPTNSANVNNTVNFNTAIHWMEVNVVTNGVTNNFRIPLFK